MDRRVRDAWLGGLCVALTALVLYAPALDGEILNWDDRKYLSDPLLGAPFGAAVVGAFTETFDRAWYPLLRLGWWAQRAVGLDSARAYHAVDLLLFAGSVAGLVPLLARFGVSVRGAVVATALWMAHPLRVESVAWLSSRKDVQSLFFGVVAALFASSRSRGAQGLAVVAFACAVLSKSMVAPVALVIGLALWVRDRSRWPLVLVAVAALDLLVARWAFGRGEVPEWPGVGWVDNLGVALHAHGDLLRRLVWPADLAAIYPLPEHPWTLGLAGAVALGAAAALAGWVGSWGWVLLALWVLPLLPVSGLVPLRYWGPDRYLLVSGLAPIVAVVAVIQHKPRMLGALAFLALPLAVLTRARIPDWRDSITLWETDVNERPGQHWTRHVNLGSAYGAARRFTEARDQYEHAFRLEPERPEVVAHYLFASVVVGGLEGPRSAVTDLLEPYPRTAEQWQQAAVGLVLIGEKALAREAIRMAALEGAPMGWVEVARERAR